MNSIESFCTTATTSRCLRHTSRKLRASNPARWQERQRFAPTGLPQLQNMPALRFELEQNLVGTDSVVIYYRGLKGMAAEMFFF